MNQFKHISVLVAIAAALVLAACGNQPEPTPTPEPAEQVALAEQRVDLIDTSWEVEYFGETEESLAVLPDTQLTLNILVDRYMGYNGCNWFLGVYDIDGAELRFNTPATTADICEDEAISTQSATYMSALVNITRYEMEGEKLVGFTVGDQKMATFIPSEPLPLEGTAWTAKFVNDGEDPAQIYYEITVSALFENGKLTGSAGCNDYEADYVIDGDKITISNIQTPGAQCEEPAGVNDVESWYLAALENAATYDALAASLLLGDDNNQSLVLFGNP